MSFNSSLLATQKDLQSDNYFPCGKKNTSFELTDLYDFDKSLSKGKLDLFYLKYNIDKDFIDNIDLSNINYLNLNNIKFTNKQYLIDLINRLNTEKEYEIQFGSKYNKNITESFNEIIDIFIEKSIKIKKLEYSMFDFNLLHIEKISNYLFNLNSVKVLNITMCESKLLSNLINNLIMYDKIVDLKFSFSLENNQINYLCEYIQSTSILKNLTISGCKTELNEQINLFNSLLINNSVTSLNLTHINLLNISLISDLVNKNSLKELILSNNNINSGWDIFLESIKNNTSIEKLFLVSVKINNNIMNQLFESLLFNNSIKKICMFDNFDFDEKEENNIIHFKNVIDRRILEELYLGNVHCNISYSFQKTIINSIIDNKHNLKKLYVKTGKFDEKLWGRMVNCKNRGKNINYILNLPRLKYNINILIELFQYISYIPQSCDFKLLDSRF